MYLAIKEIKHNKFRYGLIIFTIFLVSYLIFFLTGLAFGLANNNRSSIDNWHADSVVIDQYANDNLASSEIQMDTLPKISGASADCAYLGQMMGVASRSNEKKADISVFGIQFNQFLKPKLVQGRMPQKANEVVVDNGLEATKLGQKIKINNVDQVYKVVGITTGNKYTTAPVVYLRLTDYQMLRYGSNDTSKKISAVVLKNSAKIKKDKQFATLTMKKLINNIPGYGPEVKTFTLMIGALFVIIAFIVGIFMYILTIEKTAVYGVLRAQGISSSTLVKSLIWESSLLGLAGIGLGIIADVVTALSLPAAVPFLNNAFLVIGFSVVLLMMIILGSLFSIFKILRVDPLDAIGGV
ncbi:ABC transporter permease [Dellaglioa sp. L3N]